MEVALLRAVTDALGTTLPCASATCPVMLPVVTCAVAVAANSIPNMKMDARKRGVVCAKDAMSVPPKGWLSKLVVPGQYCSKTIGEWAALLVISQETFQRVKSDFCRGFPAETPCAGVCAIQNNEEDL